jgi:radical SAM superfamily enzyme YgiQ (UPF0313 family)
MDILLTHGYFIDDDEHEQQIMKPYPPLGLLYISSHLKAKGFAVDLYDSTFKSMTDFESYLRVEHPPVVGIACNLLTKQRVLDQIRACKEIGALVVLGGPEPISDADVYLEAGADVVVAGEGELTLEELIPQLARNGPQDLSHVPGIVYRNDSGKPVRTQDRTPIENLTSQPWPDREAIELEHYHMAWKEHHGYSSTSLITARGCPYVCKWCSHSVFGYTHRRREPEDVVEEVTWLIEKYTPDQLWYADDVFTIHPRWFLKYASLVKEKGIHIPFECISRADRLNENIVDVLAEIGCRRLWIGAESGSQRILDAMDRRTDVEDIRAKTAMLQKRGIQVGMFIMLGYEGEQESDIEATVDHLKKSNPDLFLSTVAYPIKGTRYYEDVEDKIYSHRDWEHRSDRDLLVAGRKTAAYYAHATRWMVNEVNLHRARRSGSQNYLRMAKMYLNARRGRIGMRLSRDQVDGSPSPEAKI